MIVSHIRSWTLFLSAVGFVFMLLLAMVTLLNTQIVTAKLQDIAVEKVSAYAEDTLSSVSNSTAGSSLFSLAAKLGVQADENVLEAKELGKALSSLQANHYCEEKKLECNIASFAISSSIMGKLESARKLRLGRHTVEELVAEKYDATVNGLINDVRSFALTNLIAFGAIFLVALQNKQLPRRFFYLAVIMGVYTLLACYWYFFGQDWVSAILFQNWFAATYTFSMVFVFGLLIDFIFLKGIITRMVLNIVGNLIGSLSV